VRAIWRISNWWMLSLSVRQSSKCMWYFTKLFLFCASRTRNLGANLCTYNSWVGGQRINLIQNVAFKKPISNTKHTQVCKILFDSVKWHENKIVREDTVSVLLVVLCHDAVLGAEDTHRHLTEKYGWSLPSTSLYMGDSYFESRLGHPLYYSLWFSVVFLSPSNAYTLTSP
jgi:hypothetical protein